MDVAEFVCRAGKRSIVPDSYGNSRDRRFRYPGNALEGKSEYFCSDFYCFVGGYLCGRQGDFCGDEINVPSVSLPSGGVSAFIRILKRGWRERIFGKRTKIAFFKAKTEQISGEIRAADVKINGKLI